MKKVSPHERVVVLVIAGVMITLFLKVLFF